MRKGKELFPPLESVFPVSCCRRTTSSPFSPQIPSQAAWLVSLRLAVRRSHSLGQKPFPFGNPLSVQSFNERDIFSSPFCPDAARILSALPPAQQGKGDLAPPDQSCFSDDPTATAWFDFYCGMVFFLSATAEQNLPFPERSPAKLVAHDLCIFSFFCRSYLLSPFE